VFVDWTHRPVKQAATYSESCWESDTELLETVEDSAM
jgi:hypothetical protein